MLFIPKFEYNVSLLFSFHDDLIIGFQEAMSFLSILGTDSAQITVNYQFNKSI